jgi:hypothetical protein
LYKQPEIPAKMVVAAIAVSATYRKQEKAANPRSIPVSLSTPPFFEIKQVMSHVWANVWIAILLPGKQVRYQPIGCAIPGVSATRREGPPESLCRAHPVT